MSTVMTDTPEEITPVQSRQEALNQHVLLLSPTIGWWKGMYQVPRRKTVVTVDGVEAKKDDCTTPRATLMTDKYPCNSDGKAWKSIFMKLDSRLSAVKEKYSQPFPLHGVRIVPKAVGREFMHDLIGETIGTLRQRERKLRNEGNDREADLVQGRIDEAVAINGESASNTTPVHDSGRDKQSIAYDLHILANEFCNNLDNNLAEISRENSYWEFVESKVPKSHGLMRAAFHLDVVPVELAGSGGSTSEVGMLELEEHQDVVREATARQTEQAVESMIVPLREKLAEKLADLSDLVARDGRVNEGSFKPVRDAIAKIRMFAFVANDELLEGIRQLEHRLNITVAKDLSSVSAANNGFTEAVDSFMDDVQDAQQHQRDLQEFGREFRAIDLD